MKQILNYPADPASQPVNEFWISYLAETTLKLQNEGILINFALSCELFRQVNELCIISRIVPRKR